MLLGRNLFCAFDTNPRKGFTLVTQQITLRLGYSSLILVHLYFDVSARLGLLSDKGICHVFDILPVWGVILTLTCVSNLGWYLNREIIQVASNQGGTMKGTPSVRVTNSRVARWLDNTLTQEPPLCESSVYFSVSLWIKKSHCIWTQRGRWAL